MRLTLLHKGLLLVSIPLCFEVTIFGVLINLQNQAEREAQRVHENKLINDAVNRILRSAIVLGRIQTKYSVPAFNTPRFNEQVEQLVAGFQ